MDFTAPTLGGAVKAFLLPHLPYVIYIKSVKINYFCKRIITRKKISKITFI